jgi:hypothetical protein
VLAVAAKAFQSNIVDFVNAKTLSQRLNDTQDAASHRAEIRVYDDIGNVIETHEHAGEFTEW